MAYTVWSKFKSQKDWNIERSYVLKSYADEVAKAIEKGGRMAKVTRKK